MNDVLNYIWYAKIYEGYLFMITVISGGPNVMILLLLPIAPIICFAEW